MRVAAILLIAGFASAEIIDRVAVRVGNSVITESEIYHQIRLTSFFNGENPEFGAERKRTAADRLVEVLLIKREIAANRFFERDETAGKDLLEILNRRKAELPSYGLTEDEVRKHIEWLGVFNGFIEARFRPAVQVPETEIKDYYDRNLVPAAEKRRETAPTLDESHDAVENILVQQRVDAALDRWLGQARTNVRIVYRQDAFTQNAGDKRAESFAGASAEGGRERSK